MERKYDHNATVIYVDEFGVSHAALVTAWWNGAPEGTPATPELDQSSCNLLFVVGDKEKRDQYGRQIERATSVPGRRNQSAPGRFWHWPDE